MQLLSPFQLGSLSIPNRVLFAPLTRVRANADNVPGDLMAEYYAQRASSGLLIAEATMVAADAQAWPHQPGIHSPAHIAGWQRVTDAVHAAGLSADTEAAEQVSVDKETFDLVHPDAAGPGGGTVAGVGQVLAAGARAHAEPVTEHLDVVADPRSGDGEGIGDLFGRSAVRSSG